MSTHAEIRKRWASVNWNRRTAVIVCEMKRTLRMVIAMRHRYAPQTVGKFRENYSWDGVDWSMRDADIGRKLGCSREAVRQKRKSLGLKPSGSQDSFSSP